MRALLVFFAAGLMSPALAAPLAPPEVAEQWLIRLMDLGPKPPPAACGKGNLLLGKRPYASNNTLNPQRITDDVMPAAGGLWESPLTSKLKGKSAFVTYDLGEVLPIGALLVQGDNNDRYEISVSLDGRSFTPIWTAPFHPTGGMQVRLTQGLSAEGRYLRLGFPTGDDAYSIGELQAFCAQPSVWPPPVKIEKTPKTPQDTRKLKMARGKITFGLLGLLAFLGLFAARRYPQARWLLPLGASAALIFIVYYTNEQIRLKQGETWIGLSVALCLGGLTWLWRNQDREGVWIKGERAALVALTLAAAVTWINFGTFHGSRAVHYWDTFHYYVGSKYFKENSYTRLYKCAALAEMDDGREKEVMERKIRDLRNNALLSAEEHLKDVKECRQAFTPERWSAFRQDLRLFRSEMGTDWWQKMFKDHGYNPTPVWNLVGSTLTNFGWRGLVPPDKLVNSPANIRAQSRPTRTEIHHRFEEDRAKFKVRIQRFAYFDAALYLTLFLALGWAFGLRIMAFSMVVWASGYPWAYFWTGGSFGRVPWLFFAVVGLALLKKGYGFLGGWSITWSALHRVFPAALAGGVTLQILIDLITKKKLSVFQKRIMLGATLAVGILIPLSIPVAGSARAYPDFIENSMKHKSTPLTNNMGLQTILSYRPSDIARKTKSGKFSDPFKIWKIKRKENFKSLILLYGAIILGFLVLIGYVGREAQAWEVTAMSTILLMSIFELTCYYYNFIILMAPLAFKRPRSAVVLLAAVIYGQWLQLKIGWYDEQYTAESAVIIGAALFIILERAWEIFQARRAEGGAAAPSVETPAHEARSIK
ncbi:discoidin domain-containing protein [Myxococcota bacterium]|nr:discoidin domain-containing protein [Myxococcota bacterium]MBU1429791.1 discoidin domain-containing protein [Myxococcota bacterium]MBU1897684.1 discoidin domain-containing protein [Myxococcota bacterium]